MGNPSSRWKPQELTAAEKRNVEMGPGGWVRNPVAATGNLGSGADPEVIVAFRGTASIQGWISSFRWASSVFSEATPTAITVTAYCSENVTVVGSPTITVTNTKAGSGTATTLTATFTSLHANGHRMYFVTAVPSANQLKEDDVLYIGANALALAGGTIKDYGTTTNTIITSAADVGYRGSVNRGGNATTGGVATTNPMLGARYLVAA